MILSSSIMHACCVAAVVRVVYTYMTLYMYRREDLMLHLVFVVMAKTTNSTIAVYTVPSCLLCTVLSYCSETSYGPRGL